MRDLRLMTSNSFLLFPRWLKMILPVLSIATLTCRGGISMHRLVVSVQDIHAGISFENCNHDNGGAYS